MSIAVDSSTNESTLISALRAMGPDACWVADIVPLLRRDADAPDTRYAFALIMAESVRVLADLLPNPSADHAATLIAEKVRSAIDATGVTPATLIIRGQTLAHQVQRALPHVTIETVDTFADILGDAGDHFMAESLHLRYAMDGDTIPHTPAAVAPRWSSWGIPLPDIAAFFTATATLYHATNAQGFSRDSEGEGTLFILDTPSRLHTATSQPSGHETIVTVTGMRSEREGDPIAQITPTHPHAAQHHNTPAHTANTHHQHHIRPESVTIYADPEDWDAMVESARTNPLAVDVRHPIMVLHYVSADALTPTAIQEIHTQNWDVAAETAYPWVWFLNMIGGGLTTEYLHTLTTQLSALARTIAPTIPPRHATSASRSPAIAPPSTNTPPPSLTPINADLVLHYTDRLSGITVRTIAA